MFILLGRMGLPTGEWAEGRTGGRTGGRAVGQADRRTSAQRTGGQADRRTADRRPGGWGARRSAVAVVFWGSTFDFCLN
jgi:hypothetical protein